MLKCQCTIIKYKMSKFLLFVQCFNTANSSHLDDIDKVSVTRGMRFLEHQTPCAPTHFPEDLPTDRHIESREYTGLLYVRSAVPTSSPRPFRLSLSAVLYHRLFDVESLD